MKGKKYLELSKCVEKVAYAHLMPISWKNSQVESNNSSKLTQYLP